MCALLHKIFYILIMNRQLCSSSARILQLCSAHTANSALHRSALAVPSKNRKYALIVTHRRAILNPRNSLIHNYTKYRYIRTSVVFSVVDIYYLITRDRILSCILSCNLHLYKQIHNPTIYGIMVYGNYLKLLSKIVL